jgi:putative FmdB family regulatory protein
MPTYSYLCRECGLMDVHQYMTDDPLTHCPKCNSDSFYKKINAASVQFKGSGFYITDSRGK